MVAAAAKGFRGGRRRHGGGSPPLSPTPGAAAGRGRRALGALVRLAAAVVGATAAAVGVQAVLGGRWTQVEGGGTRLQARRTAPAATATPIPATDTPYVAHPPPPPWALPRSGGGFPSVVGGGGGACDGAVGAAPTAGSDRVLPRSAQPRCAPSQAKGLQGAGGGVPAQQTVWRRPPWAAPRALTERRRLGGARRPRWRGQKAQVGSAAPIERSCTVLLCVQRSLPEAPSLPFGRQCHQHLFEANQD